MNNITNINNKPLKCVITNNKNAIKYFSTTYGTGKEAYAGTLIIYENPKYNEPKSGYREIYLNEKFLAGGYGFETEELVSKLRDIAGLYATDIEKLNNEDYRLSELFNTKLDKNGPNANASNVYFEYNDSRRKHKLYIKDIIELLSKAPQYKDLEVVKILMAGKYIDYEGHDKDIAGNAISSSNNTLQYYDINSFTLPINAKLKYVAVNIDFKYNHSGGIGQLKVYYHLTQNLDELATSQDFYINNTADKSSGNISFKLNFLDSNPFIVGEDNDIISKIDLNVLATPQEKYQTISIDDKEIIYIGNIIQNHTEELKIPSIKGSYYLIYDTNVTTIAGENEDLALNSSMPSDLYGHKKYVKIISNNDNNNNFTYIQLNKSTNELIDKIILILPYKFTIRQAYLVNGSDEISITNFLNYFAYSNNNFIQNNLRSCLYYIYIQKGLKRDYILKLDIVEDEIITYNDMNYDYTNTISLVNGKTMIINSDEIHKYWINENNLPNVNNTSNSGLAQIFNYDKL